VNLKELDAAILRLSRHPEDKDPKATDGSPIPTYAGLGLAGEAGECAELVKKALRTDAPIDRAEAALELGDVAYYLGRYAARLGLTMEDVVFAMVMKAERRSALGKDPEGEKRAMAAYLASVPPGV
jgi:NTP pyrophosphatase (non-canonical NTP hydrolase)